MDEQSSQASSAERAEAARERREAFLRQMGEVYDRMMDSLGTEGVTFDDIEDQALVLGREASRQLMALRLGAEESDGNRAGECARCGHALRRSEKANPRNLETCAGVVSYERQHAYCDRCRASFSPSGQAAEDSVPGFLQSSDPQDL